MQFRNKKALYPVKRRCFIVTQLSTLLRYQFVYSCRCIGKKIVRIIDLFITDQFKKKKLPKDDFEKKLGELQALVTIRQKSKDVVEKMKKRTELASFSPWLVEGYEGEVEIPGQYTGESRPLIHQHLTIVGFSRTVSVSLVFRISSELLWDQE